MCGPARLARGSRFATPAVRRHRTPSLVQGPRLPGRSGAPAPGTMGGSRRLCDGRARERICTTVERVGQESYCTTEAKRR